MTAEVRAQPMIESLERGEELPPPKYRLKSDGRFEIVDGNARTHAYRKTGRKVPRAIIASMEPTRPEPAALSAKPVVVKDVQIVRDKAGRITKAVITERTES